QGAHAVQVANSAGQSRRAPTAPSAADQAAAAASVDAEGADSPATPVGAQTVSVKTSFRGLTDANNISAIGVTLQPSDQALAVNKTNNPNGAYFIYQFDYKRTMNGQSTFADFPTFGYDNIGFYIGTNQFNRLSAGATFEGSTVAGCNKSLMKAGKPTTCVLFS